MDEFSRLSSFEAQPIRELKKKSLAELEALLESKVCETDSRQRDIVLNMITHKQLEEVRKPHWTLTPAFWVSVVAAVAACIAAYPVVSEWFAPTKSHVLQSDQTPLDISKSQAQQA